jgi:hypothetical protein
METLYVSDQNFGAESFVGTRDDFKRALADVWAVWHAQQGSNLPIDEYTERALDEHLREATEKDLKTYRRLF